MLLKSLSLASMFYLYNSFITHFPSYHARHWYLKTVLGIPIGKKSSVHMGCFFSGKHVSIGSNTIINRNVYIDGRFEGVRIGNNVSISPEAYILSMTHDAQSPVFEPVRLGVIIHDYAWIGVRSVIMPGVIIGKGAVTGAASLVTNSIPDYDIVGGVPARKISERNQDLSYKLDYQPYFNTDIG